MTKTLAQRCDAIRELFDHKIEEGYDTGIDSDQLREWYDESSTFGTLYIQALGNPSSGAYITQAGKDYIESQLKIIERIYQDQLKALTKTEGE